MTVCIPLLFSIQDFKMARWSFFLAFLCVTLFCCRYSFAQKNSSDKGKRIVEYDSDGPVYGFDPLEYVQSLQKFGILPSPNKEQLLIAIRQKKIRQPADAMKYCSNTISIDLKQYRGWSEQRIVSDLYRKIIHDLVDKSVVLNCISKLRHKDSTALIERYFTETIIDGELYKEYTEYKVEVDDILRAADSNFKHTSYLSNFAIGFHSILYFLVDNLPNKTLYVTGSSNSTLKYFSLVETHPLALLKPNAARDSLLSELNHLTTYKIIEPRSVESQKEYIRNIRSIGVSDLMDRSNYQYFLRSLPCKPVVNISGEIDFYQSGYEAQSKAFSTSIDSLRQLSKGVFEPDSLFDNLAEELKKPLGKDRVFQFGFRLKGRVYQKLVGKQALNEKDPPAKQIESIFRLGPDLILPIANKALKDIESKFRFYEVAESNTMAAVMLLSREQFNYLKNRVPDLLIVDKALN
jgi:hypothetical protein